MVVDRVLGGLRITMLFAVAELLLLNPFFRMTWISSGVVGGDDRIVVVVAVTVVSFAFSLVAAMDDEDWERL